MRRIIWLLPLVLLLVACQLLEEGEDAPAATETAVIPTAAATPEEETTSRTPEPLAPPPSTITLTVWLAPELAPTAENPGGSVLQEQLNAFDNSHPDINLAVALKTVSDPGGILSYLRAGRPVAPSILPDLVLLPASQLQLAATQQLIFPLDDYLSPELVDDLYPAAREMAAVEGVLYGYPFALDNVQHLVYDSAVITRTLTPTWPALVALSAPPPAAPVEEGATPPPPPPPPPRFIFPAAGRVGGEFILQLYLAAGGTLVNEAGQPALQSEILATVLEQINQGVLSGFIDVESANTATVEQAWQLFQNSTTSIVETTASHYLRQQAEGVPDSYDFLPLPGLESPLAPQVTGWSWAISTPDPARQALAAELLAWLVSDSNLGDWTRASYLLPARRAAFTAWPEEEPYIAFIQEQLLVAEPYPPEATPTLLLALSKAASDVISQLNTPLAAAEEAAAALQSP